MMDKKVKGTTKFSAYAYRPYSAGLRRAARAGDDPRAADRGRDRRRDRGQLPQQDRRAGDDPPARGLLLARRWTAPTRGEHTDPGGFVQKKQTFQYVWEAREGTEGAWLYHDHGPMDPMPVYKGLFGPLHHPHGRRRRARPGVLRRLPLLPRRRRPGFGRRFSCINGRAYAGNTPTLQSEGRRRRRLPRLRDRQRLPHLPHPRPSLDGRRTGTVVDNKTLGPGDSITARVHRGQPRPLALPLPRVQPPARGDERLVPRQLSRRAAFAAAAGGRCRARAATGGERLEPADLDLATTSGRTRRSSSTSAST